MFQFSGIRKNKHLLVNNILRIKIKTFYEIIKLNFYLGFGLGSVEGRVAINYIQPQSSKDNFTFKCHRQSNSGTMNGQDIYAVCISEHKLFLIYLVKLLSGE